MRRTFVVSILTLQSLHWFAAAWYKKKHQLTNVPMTGPAICLPKGHTPFHYPAAIFVLAHCISWNDSQ